MHPSAASDTPGTAWIFLAIEQNHGYPLGLKPEGTQCIDGGTLVPDYPHWSLRNNKTHPTHPWGGARAPLEESRNPKETARCRAAGRSKEAPKAEDPPRS